jgi:hypothetical protein
MTEMTPGQAAYEAYWANRGPVIGTAVAIPADWEGEQPERRAQWEAAAKAAAKAATAPLREQLAAIAAEMEDQAQLIAPHSSAPGEMPDMADQIRAEVLTETAGRIRAAMEG